MKEFQITDLSEFKDDREAVEYYKDWYRRYGYPNYSRDDYEPFKELDSLWSFDESSIRHGDVLDQTMHCLGFLWTYFPDWVNTKSNGGKSLMDCWNDDALFNALIEKLVPWVRKHDRGKWTTNRIRQITKVYCSKQSVSNFRPTVAKYLYNTYGNKGRIFDPCGGWGGRMMGFFASRCKEYECCDPSVSTAKGLQELSDTYRYLKKEVKVNCVPVEDFEPRKEYFDMAFTSPPYFNTEEYSKDDTQSYLRYPEYSRWVKGFLSPMIGKCFDAVKHGGYVLMNVANTKTAPDLEKDTFRLLEDTGMEHIETLKMVLSSIAGKGVKYEPVFVFRKN